MNKARVCTASCALALMAACGREPAPVSAPPPPTKPALPAVTMADWRAMVDATMTKTNVESADGVEDFSACFGTPEPNKRPPCSEPLYRARYDGFNKFYRFQHAGSVFRELVLRSSPGPSGQVHTLALIGGCDSTPSITLAVNFFGSTWAFISSVAVLADGNVLYEQKMPHDSVARDVDGRTITERGRISLTSAHWATLQKAAAAKDLHIRIQGDKGYVMVNADGLGAFRKEVLQTASVVEKITNSLKDVGERGCIK